MVALALNTGLIPLTKRATTAKKTVRRTVAPKVRRSLLFLASTLSSRDERTNGWMDGCAQPLPSARSVFFFNAVDVRRRASSGSRFRVDPPSRLPTRVRSRRRLAPFASAPARRRPRGKRDDDDDPRAIGRSVDRSIVPLGRCERTMRTMRSDERRGRTNDGARSLDRSHRRTDARTHGRADARTEPSSSFVRVVRIESPTRTTRRVRSGRVTTSRVRTHGDGTT